MRKRARRIVRGVQKIVWRLSAGFVARDELRAVGCGERDNFFVALVVTAEKALRLQCLRVEAVEERTVAIGRSAYACEKNIFAVLDDGSVAIGQRAFERQAGIFVTF